MKDYHLVYNAILDNYIFYEGRSMNDDRREEFGQRDPAVLTAALRQRLDFKRKSLLHLVSIPEEVIPRIKKLFENTKVKVIYEE